jgi:hypothetical protein
VAQLIFMTRSRILLALAVWLLACGNTVVVEEGLVAGAGGADPSALAACNELESDVVRSVPDLVVLPKVRLATTRADGSQLSLFFNDEAGPFAHVTFLPWGAWSASPLGQTVPLFAGQGDFAVPRAPEDGYGLVLKDSYLHRASVDDDYPLFNLVDSGADDVLFITGIDDNNDRLRGFYNDSDGLELHVGDQLTTDSIEGIACGEDPMLDAMAIGDGFLLALSSSGRSLSDCAQPEAPAGNIVLMHFWRDAPAEVIDVIEVGGEVSMLRLVPRSSGAWLLWAASETADEALDGQLVAVELDAEFRPASDWLVDSDRFGGNTDAIAPRGDGFVMSSHGSNGLVELEVFGPDAQLTARLEYPIPEAHAQLPTLAAAADGSAIVTAWVDSAPTGSQAGPVELQRFRCLE